MDKVHKQKPGIKLRRLPRIPSLPNRKQKTKFERFFEWKENRLVTKHELKKLLGTSERHINEDLLKDSELILDRLLKLDERVESKLMEIQKIAHETQFEVDQKIGQFQEQLKAVKEDVISLSEKAIKPVKLEPNTEIEQLQQQISQLNHMRANDRRLIEGAFERLEKRIGKELEKLIGWIDFFNKKL